MKSFVFFAFCLFLTLLASPVLQAQTGEPAEMFYIEVGDDMPATDVQQSWKELAAKHKSQLGKLKLFPKTVMENGGAKARMQAGPIDSKIKAQKICNRLFADQVPCFVIEGLTEAPPSSISNLTGSTGQAADSGNMVGAAPPVAGYVTLPWLAGASPQRQAEVHVAEAIRVQPTDESLVLVQAPTPIMATPLTAPVEPAKRTSYDDESDDSGAGWLVVQSFADEEVARSFWDEVHAGMLAKDKKGLHARIITPVKSGEENHTSLNVGPFSSSHLAYNFCREHIQADERGLSCRFSGKEPGAQEENSHSEAYAQRRRPIENPVVDSDGQQYWVQVIAAPTQEEAQSRWDDLRAQYKRLFTGIRGAVTEQDGQFIVYSGPFATQSTAETLCGKLKAQGGHCSVAARAANN